jgi:hypothetical protein
MYDFNPFGNKGIVVSFRCVKCNTVVESDEIAIPSPDFSAEKSSDSYNYDEDYAVCPNTDCNEEYEITVGAGFDGAHAEVDGVDIDAVNIRTIEDPAERDYYIEQFESISENKEIYLTFQNSIKNLIALNAIDGGTNELNEILKRQIYVGVIASMESFLADAFIKLVEKNQDAFKRFIRTSPEFAERKFSLNEIFERFEAIRKEARIVMLDVIYHNLAKVKKMYEATFLIDFPAISEPSKAVSKRHDLVHRNGKTKNGDLLTLGNDDISNVIGNIKKFVDELAEKLEMKTKDDVNFNADDVFGHPGK